MFSISQTVLEISSIFIMLFQLTKHLCLFWGKNVGIVSFARKSQVTFSIFWWAPFAEWNNVGVMNRMSWMYSKLIQFGWILESIQIRLSFHFYTWTISLIPYRHRRPDSTISGGIFPLKSHSSQPTSHHPSFVSTCQYDFTVITAFLTWIFRRFSIHYNFYYYSQK